MEMVLGFAVLLVCLFLGIRHGGIGLAVISGIGLMLYTFVFHYKPGTPPIGVMLTILAVVTCAGFLQTSGGLTVMLKYAEKFLRNNPKHITILAPVTTWFLTVLCGTGHVVYTMFPIITIFLLSRISVRNVRWRFLRSRPRWGFPLLPFPLLLFPLSDSWRLQGRIIHCSRFCPSPFLLRFLVFSARLFTVTDVAGIWKRRSIPGNDKGS